MASPTPPAPTATHPRITLRQPTNSPSASSGPTITPPPLSWLAGTWNVTHSSLPLWRKHRNVQITYTPLPSTGSAGGNGKTAGSHIEDVVTYQALDKSKGGKISTVRGVDKPLPTPDAPTTPGLVAHADTAPAPQTPDGEELASLCYHWRGRGWLMIASSRWEILGYGEEEGGNRWIVTFFEKTVFSPAGVDFYSGSGTLGVQTVSGISEAVKGLGGEVSRLGGEVLEVLWDGEREG